MAELSEERIRERAFQLWKEAGEPKGQMDTFWYRAEKDLLAEREAGNPKPVSSLALSR